MGSCVYDWPENSYVLSQFVLVSVPYSETDMEKVRGCVKVDLVLRTFDYYVVACNCPFLSAGISNLLVGHYALSKILSSWFF